MSFEVSFFANAYAKTPHSTKALRDILEDIRAGKWKGNIHILRTLEGRGIQDSPYDRMKKRLPAFTTAGVFSHRKAKGLKKHSGVLACDFDKLPDVAKAKSILRADPHVLFAFVSPSGDGIKAGVLIDGAKHLQCFRSAETYFRDRYGLTMDESGKDVNRLCFVSSDPDAFFRDDAQVLPITEPPPVSRGKKQPRIPITNDKLTAEDVAEMLRFIPTRPQYDDWLRFTSSVFSILPFGDAFRVLNDWSPEETPGEYQDKFDNRLESIGPGTLVQVAKSHGYDPKERFRRKLAELERKVRAGQITRKDGESQVIELGHELQSADPVSFDTCKDVAEKLGIPTRAFTQAVKVYDRDLRNDKVLASGKPIVRLPGLGRTEAEFAVEVSAILSRAKHWFFRGGQIVTVGESHLEPMTPLRSATALDEHCLTVVATKGEGGEILEPRTPSQQTLAILLKSDVLRNGLPKIETLLHCPVPVLRNGKITFPGVGYDPELKVYLVEDSPKIEPVDGVDNANAILEDVIGDFCFTSPQDRTNLIAYLLTPFCKGLLPSWSTRCPVWVFIGNRQRAGKDYAAGLAGIVFEGVAVESSPILGNKDHENDELRKLLCSSLMQGTKRLHFANCRGFIASKALEQFLTSSTVTMRILGGNDTYTGPNEIDVSLSGNVGVTFTPDLSLRSRQINLSFFEEDANARRFKHPDLHNYARENRGLILGALGAYVREWDHQGRPTGQTPFTSFPAWASVVGGIMGACNLGDPCQVNENDFSAVDSETDDMRALFERIYDNVGSLYQLSAPIRNTARELEERFEWVEFDTRSGQTRFSQKLRSYIGRELGGLKLVVDDRPKKSEQHRFKVVMVGDLGDVGDVHNPKHCGEDISQYEF